MRQPQRLLDMARAADQLHGAGAPDLPGLTPKDYHLYGGERLNGAASRAWSQRQAAWKTFRKRFADLPASDTSTTVTRDEWQLPLLQEMGYGRLQTKPAVKFEDKEYPVSHGWESHVPIHLLSACYLLDCRTPGVAGADARSPYSMMQDLLNRGFSSTAHHKYDRAENLHLRPYEAKLIHQFNHRFATFTAQRLDNGRLDNGDTQLCPLGADQPGCNRRTQLV